MFRVLRQGLRQKDPWHIGRDGIERPAIFRRRIGLRVIRLKLTWPTVEPNENHRLVVLCRGSFSLQLQKVAQRQPTNPQRARFQSGPPRHSRTVGKRRPGLKLQHCSVPLILKRLDHTKDSRRNKCHLSLRERRQSRQLSLLRFQPSSMTSSAQHSPAFTDGSIRDKEAEDVSLPKAQSLKNDLRATFPACRFAGRVVNLRHRN